MADELPEIAHEIGAHLEEGGLLGGKTKVEEDIATRFDRQRPQNSGASSLDEIPGSCH